MAKSDLSAALAKIDSDIAKLEEMRDYLRVNAPIGAGDFDAGATAPKTRKTRKPRGLPVQDAGI